MAVMAVRALRRAGYVHMTPPRRARIGGACQQSLSLWCHTPHLTAPRVQIYSGRRALLPCSHITTSTTMAAPAASFDATPEEVRATLRKELFINGAFEASPTTFDVRAALSCARPPPLQRTCTCSVCCI